MGCCWESEGLLQWASVENLQVLSDPCLRSLQQQGVSIMTCNSRMTLRYCLQKLKHRSKRCRDGTGSLKAGPCTGYKAQIALGQKGLTGCALLSVAHCAGSAWVSEGLTKGTLHALGPGVGRMHWSKGIATMSLLCVVHGGMVPYIERDAILLIFLL